jgi:Outer membrane receptor proteins, mostly Fe transport
MKNSVVKGIVKDASGEPLIGVNVVIKGRTNIGTITDMDGRFSINCENKDILVISYIGYATQEVAVDGRSSLSITLKEDLKQLDEVIVIGYGTTTRKSVVGAVDQVKSGMIEDRPVANMTQALQGASPNLIIQQRSFNPNDNTTNINIRGISTTNNNDPLIVIDGLVADAGSLNKLNPQDIDNISILKDAGTSAIYGSRSSNGVLLINTKKGTKNERPVVRLNGMVGWEDPKNTVFTCSRLSKCHFKEFSLN